jgi:ABC-type polysaccharide/polyol phosphate export permease
MLVSPIWINYEQLFQASLELNSTSFHMSPEIHAISFNTFYYLNPISGILELGKEAVSSTPQLSPFWYLSAIISIIVFVTGLLYFKSVERKMADLV